ncbi:ABC transporter ATP-binding protein [Chitinophaga parva]|uniref:ABC transporter ATP-binding protein n=1 Tax=Chitinophaga parva TaxID=2169414 RepID=A0A2T7BDL8_9BACT|nr:ABC transporter ATP-binding protein [Chitinophaga parva]PUZ23120.1 ABC transporter ATP-binding protein [Chitinophaga parva]
MKNPYINLLRTAWKYARNERKRYVFTYFLFICSNACDAANPIILGWLVGKLQHDTQHILRYTLIYVGLYLFFRLAVWAFHGPARIMERHLAFNLSRNFLQERYHQVLHLPVKWHQDNHSGATINRVRKAYESLRQFFDRGFMYLHALAKFLFSVIAMLYFSPLYGTIGILMGLGVILVVIRFDKPFIKAEEEVNEREHTVSATLFDTLSNIMTVITLRLESSVEKGLMAKVHAILRPFSRSARINEWKWFTADNTIGLIYCVITFGYVYQHWTPGTLFNVAGLVTLLGFVNNFTSVFQDITWQYTEIVQYNTAIETASLISEAYAAQHRPDEAPALPARWQHIRVEDLQFSHHAKDMERPQSLQHIHLDIRRGQRIAFIGESGSGKSTLLSLLRGLYTPERASLYVDGQPMLLDTVNESVTLFPQEPEIFENTIAYNITLGLPFPDAAVQEVTRRAHFAEVVAQLPMGMQSDIREKGVNLSGGQKQRLALALGILAARDSQLVLLDEPTSSVDPKTEMLIYEDLFRAFADKAVISSLHRLHLLRLFDYVYVLRQGRIVEEGSFEYLRAHGPIFQELWKHQENL